MAKMECKVDLEKKSRLLLPKQGRLIMYPRSKVSHQYPRLDNNPNPLSLGELLIPQDRMLKKLESYSNYWKTNVEPLVARQLIKPKEEAIDIFQALIARANDLKIVNVDSQDDWMSDGSRITIVDVVNIILAADQTNVSARSGNGDSQFSKSLLLASLLANSTSVNTGDHERTRLRSYASLSIPTHGKFSVAFPKSWKDRPAMFASDQQSGLIYQSLSVVPGSWITAPHMDDFSTPMTIYHISGDKIWLLWPVTPKNVAALEMSCLFEIDWHIPVKRAIEELEGMAIVFASEPCVFQVPAGTIHAVITLNNAYHIGVVPLSPHLFKQSMENLNIVLDRYEKLAKDLTEYEARADNDTMAEAFNALLKWKELVEMGGHEGATRQVDQILREILQRLFQVANSKPFFRGLVMPDWILPGGKRKGAGEGNRAKKKARVQ